ncbi:MAG: M20/M25/M40 family metallo-hydrolase [Amoebophilaceae bacterium]|jgi:putative aminopeptidase FrvX|nr:M20/M25/M40 family metallo-hydrolase [Amoebophilaceae bacterium]
MHRESKSFLFEYLNNTSPTGYETAGQKIWLNYLNPYIDDFLTDTYGTAVGIINPQATYKVVIEAHADEISWFVNYITKDGYIYVIRNGGSDYQIAPSQRAKIHTEKGTIPAVFGWPAIHVREDKDKAPKLDIEKIVLDCGCSSAEEVEALGVHVGSVVTFDADLITLNRDFLVGRGLDNRIGGFMIAEVARRLHEHKQKLPFGLYIVNAVQEEVGLNGAAMVARRLKPDLAIITDVTHDTQSPLYNKVKEGDIACGKGPVLSHAPSVQHNVLKMLIEVARKNNLPFQRQASSSRTGTDTDAFAYSSVGVASGLISLPLKYMHTTVEMVHEQDMEHVIALMYQFLVQLDPQHSFSYFK